MQKRTKKKIPYKVLLSLVLLVMLLKCFKYKTNIPEENLIVNNFMPPKKYLAQEMRLENWISHKQLYQTENARPDLGGFRARIFFRDRTKWMVPLDLALLRVYNSIIFCSFIFINKFYIIF